jgi:hypothetical protein
MKHLLMRYREGCYHGQELSEGCHRQTALLGRTTGAAQVRRRQRNLPMYVPAKHEDTHASEAGMETHLVQRQAQPIERMRWIRDLDPLCIARSAFIRGITLGWI